jgi:hypothetical protein
MGGGTYDTILYYVYRAFGRKGGKYNGETIVFNLHVGDISF